MLVMCSSIPNSDHPSPNYKQFVFAFIIKLTYKVSCIKKSLHHTAKLNLSWHNNAKRKSWPYGLICRHYDWNIIIYWSKWNENNSAHVRIKKELMLFMLSLFYKIMTIFLQKNDGMGTIFKWRLINCYI